MFFVIRVEQHLTAWRLASLEDSAFTLDPTPNSKISVAAPTLKNREDRRIAPERAPYDQAQIAQKATPHY